MPRLAIALLGPPIIDLDGEAVQGLTFQKARALLIYLAVERGKRHAREHLVGLLWPDQSDSASRTNLRQALAVVRKAIQDQTAVPPFMVIDKDTIQLTLEGEIWLDVQEFTDLLDACAAHHHRHAKGCRSCATRLEKAVDLYRGDFLAGFYLRQADPFDEWAAIVRERLHRRMVDALGRLAEHHETCRDIERAEHYVGRQLELDPWMEEAHQNRMRLLALAGKRSQALAQFETCRQLLHQALGVEPSSETVSLYQQVRDGTFPAADSVTHRDQPRLPRQAAKLVGRDEELAELAELLEDPDHRLVSLTGPGGVGKSRLAAAVAEAVAPSFPDGVLFFPLESLDSADQIPAAILAELGIASTSPVDPAQLSMDALKDLDCLLVLDGIEHLLPEARVLVTDLLEQSRHLAVLCTTQERLGLQAEWCYELAGLNFPSNDDPLGAMASGAVRLFLDRAGQVDRSLDRDPEELANVIRICRTVEGVPLAIELAASALGVRTVAEIARSLEADIHSLASRHRDTSERHRSQAAAFDYSWSLLEVSRRADLRRLSVFRGGWNQEAAIQVGGVDDEGLGALVDKSLIHRDRQGRYSFHPLIRELALERLELAGERSDIRTAHLHFFCDLASAAAEALSGPEQGEWLDALDDEQANLRQALSWAFESKETSLAAGLCLALARYWMVRGPLREGQDWIERLLAMDPSPQPEDRIKLLNRAGILAAMQRRFEEADQHLTASVELSRKTGDRMGEVTSLNSLGALSIEQEQYERARGYLETCLAGWGALENTDGMARTLNNLGVTALMQGEPEQAESRFDESLQLFRQLGDRRMIAGVLYNLGDLNVKAGNLQAARASLRESLDLRRQIGEIAGVAEAMEGLAMVFISEGRAVVAAQLFGASATIRDQLGIPLAPVNQPDYDRFVDQARHQIGPEAFESAFTHGQELTTEQAIELALTP